MTSPLVDLGVVVTDVTITPQISEQEKIRKKRERKVITSRKHENKVFPNKIIIGHIITHVIVQRGDINKASKCNEPRSPKRLTLDNEDV